jgi:hypothetical protein
MRCGSVAFIPMRLGGLGGLDTASIPSMPRLGPNCGLLAAARVRAGTGGDGDGDCGEGGGGAGGGSAAGCFQLGPPAACVAGTDSPSYMQVIHDTPSCTDSP